MRLKYLQLFESEYWAKLTKLAGLGLAGPDYEKVLDWLEKKRQDPDNDWNNIDFEGLSLKELPPGPWQTRGLANFSRSELRSLPEGFRCSAGLYLTDMPNLERLPDGLHVGGDLAIFRCPKLESLPEGLHVGKDLTVFDTPLRAMPAQYKVRNRITIMDTFVPQEELMALWRKRKGPGGEDEPGLYFSGHNGPTEGPRPR